MNIKIGKKEITLKPWTARTRVEFTKLFSSDEANITDKDIVDTLILPYISTPEVYFSSDEYQYILILLKGFSISEDIKFDMACTKCKEEFKAETTLESITNFTPSNFPITVNETTFDDISKAIFLEDAIKRNPNKNREFLEMLLHIKDYKGVPSTSLEENIKLFENISLKELSKVEEAYYDNISILTLGTELKCPHCEANEYYDFDIVPNFFEELLPKG